MTRVAVIPAAGRGTRMLPITKVVPKELLALGKLPVIHHVVEEGIAAGITEFVFVTRPGDRRVVDYFDPIDGVTLQAAEQDEPRGLGDAVSRARDLVDGRPFAVMLPDMLIHPKGQGLPRMLQGVPPEGRNTVLLNEVAPDDVRKYGIAKLDEAGTRIIDLVEKPAPAEAPSRMAVQGRYAFTADLFPLLEEVGPDKRGEVQLTDAIRALAKQAEVIATVLEDAEVFDCGSPEGYAMAFNTLA